MCWLLLSAGRLVENDASSLQKADAMPYTIFECWRGNLSLIVKQFQNNQNALDIALKIKTQQANLRSSETGNRQDGVIGHLFNAQLPGCQ